jgi:hypothetical protein
MFVMVTLFLSLCIIVRTVASGLKESLIHEDFDRLELGQW